ncbi:oligosaccharide flippase family protein [Haloarcula nitratireducens]|uniref:Oligosaccharide flippase family protein n=1 Tax=Haloarcula nitratireducens TaxID=2487749 RepID=A0AAW4PFD6_9EURY|nr:oligosaccharide flippase family protein [Halomicroarcula nitratireducens]MBX0296664.1 oligosaccharide flippase family protein [Halomicroarcula nitratireducens]
MTDQDISEKFNIFYQVLSGTGAKIVLALVGFIGSIYFARVLGPVLFGGVSLIYALAEWASHPMYGVGAATKKRVSESDKKRGVLFGLLIISGAIWTFIIGVLAVGLEVWIVSLTSLTAAPEYLIGITATTGMFTVLGRLVEGRGKISAYLWTNAARKTVAVLFQAVLLYIGFGTDGWAAGIVFTSAISLLILSLYVESEPRIPNKNDILNVWEFAKYSLITSTLYAGYSRLDLFLLGSIISTSVAGYYQVAWQITMFGIFVPTVIGNSLMPKISALANKGQWNELLTEVRSGTSFASIITIPVLFGALAVGNPLITIIYGSEYTPATNLLVAVALVRVIDSQSDSIIAAISGLDRPDITLLITLAGIITNILIGLPALYLIGPVGLVIISALSETVRWFGGVIFLRKKFKGFNPVGKIHAIQIVSGSIMFILVKLVTDIIVIDTIYELFATIIFGGSIYTLLIIGLSEQTRILVYRYIPSSKVTE